MTQVGLRTLGDAHLEVDRVAFDVLLHRLDVGEHITVVVVKVAGGIVVFLEPLVEELLVIHVARLHAQHRTEIVRRINRIAHPVDAADVILLTLTDLQPDADVLRVDVPHAVAEDGGIAVTELIVFLDELFLISLPALRRELFRLKEGGKFAGLMSLGKGTFLEETALDARILEFLVAFDGDGAHLHLRLLVDVDVEDDLILLGYIVALGDFDVGVLKALVIKILLCQYLSTVNHVGRNLTALQDAEFLFHILALRLFKTVVIDLRHTRAWAEGDVEPNLVADDGVGRDLHVGEQTMTPIALDGIGNLAARHRDALAYRQSGDAREHIILVAVHTRDIESADGQRARRTRVGDVGMDDNILRRSVQRGEERKDGDEYFDVVLHLV